MNKDIYGETEPLPSAIQMPLGEAEFAGQVLGGSYKLLTPVGKGGMASVWLAEHTRTQGKLAVKIVHSKQIASPKAAQRFELEARHTASLHHPNIVQVFDYGRDASLGLLYQVMEFVRGESLQAVLNRERQMGWERAVHIVEQMLMALIAAHESERCLVHRDIKPANILLTDHAGRQDTVKVVDFGISRALYDDANATRVGVVLGTPSTMSPEQWQSKPVSPATDLYSVGCTVYRMLAGHPPFQGQLHELAFQHSHATPASLFDSAHSDTPKALGMWIEWLMRKEPSQRPQSARQALALLRNIGEEEGPSFEASSTLDTMESADFTLGAVRLPSYRSSFVGRADEQAELSALAKQHARLVTVRGTGGLGKSRLAVEWAKERHKEFAGGIYFCDLSEARTLQAICINLAEVLDVPLGQGDPVQTLGYALSSRSRTLIIFDNYEQIVALAPDTVGVWLDMTEEAMFIVTSRQALRLDGEQVMDVQPLSTSAGQANEAVGLFVDRAQSVRPSFELTDGVADDVARLVTALDGLPLAIELAAARVQAMSPAKMVARLSQRFKLLRSSRRDATDRQMTLEATLDWSWELLEPHEKAAFVQCAVFQGTFSLEAAEVVVELSMFDEDPWVVDVLESLVDKSLIRLVTKRGHEERYAMFLSVHEYAQAKLDAGTFSSNQRAVGERHLAFFSPYGERVFLERVAQDRRALDELEKERDNIIAALAFAQKHTLLEPAGLCALAVCGYLEHRGPYQEGLAYVERVLLASSKPSETHARLLQSAGTLARSAGLLTQAQDSYQRCLVVARSVGDAVSEGHALYGLGFVLRDSGELKQARVSYQNSLQLARSVGDRLLEGHALYGLGFVSRDEGLSEEALDAFQGCLRLARLTHHKLLEGSALQGLWWVQSDLGQLEQAQVSYEACLALARDIGHKLLEGSVLCGLGYALKDQGKPDEALETFQACLVLARDIGHKRLEGTALDGLGSALSALGIWDEAEQAYHACLELARSVGIKHLECYALTGLGFVLEVQGKLERAKQSYDASLVLAREVGHKYLEGDALQGLWSVLLTLKEPKQALEAARAIVSLADDAGLPSLEGQGQLGIGAVLRVQSEALDAEKALQRANTLAISAQNYELQASSLLALAQLYLEQQKSGQAADVLAKTGVLLAGECAGKPLLALEHDALQAWVCVQQNQHTKAHTGLKRATTALTDLKLGHNARLADLVARVQSVYEASSAG